MTYLRQFGAFLFDFLVGDAWELFLGPLAAVAIGWGLLQLGVQAGIVGGLLFATVIGIAALHVGLALRSSV
jgi:hypothetical protein